MIQCSIHGLTDLAQTCRHIAEAKAAAVRDQAHVARDIYGSPILLCERCLARCGRVIADVWEDGPVPVCEDCLIAWHAATGQGDLVARVATKE
jgi:hypothetical protein